MNHLDCPNFNIYDVFCKCIENAKSETRSKYQNAIEEFIQASDEYDTLGNRKRFDLIPKKSSEILSDNDCIQLYTYHMVQRSGRDYYISLLNQNNVEYCPYCNLNFVNTLDHYLPKAVYPKLSITPLNLVPSCSDCNGKKLKIVPESEGDQLFHPYFDNVDLWQWLEAKIAWSAEPIIIEYFVRAKEEWENQSLYMRIDKLFINLGLGRKYSSRGSTQLRAIISYIQTNKLERAQQKFWFSQNYATYKCSKGLNDWETVLYKELIAWVDEDIED